MGNSYLKRSVHVGAFVSQVNQPCHCQPNEKPPGEAEEVQKTVEVPGEEHDHCQRVLKVGSRGESRLG